MFMTTSTFICAVEEIFSAPRTNLTNGMSLICDGWDKDKAFKPVVDCGGHDVEIVCDCCSTCCNDEILSRNCDESVVYYTFRSISRETEFYRFMFKKNFVYPKASLLKKLSKN